jgi:hypothetical protein
LGDGLALDLREVRVEERHEKHQPIGVGVVPRLVLEGVVEDFYLSGLPATGVIGDADGAVALWDDKGEVDS